MKIFIRKLLPSSLKKRIIRFRNDMSLLSIQLFSSHRLMAGLYYLILSRQFDSEHLSVLKGRLRYYSNLDNIGFTSPLLRRNVHRIEKGLIMRPRRDLFAEDYILETVQVYQKAVKRKGYSNHEIKWASDVLNNYFSLVKSSPAIDRAKLIFNDSMLRSKESRPVDSIEYKPYPYSSSSRNEVSFGDLATLYSCRRSVRWFKPKTVSFDLIQQIIDIAVSAPSACNRQPYKFLVSTDPMHASAIAECAGGTGGFSHQIPAIIVVIGDLSAYPYERDRHLIYIDSSLASMQLMLAACTVGLATCPINWPDISSSEKKLRKLIKLSAHERVIMLIAIGYGDQQGGIPFSQKKTGSLIAQQLKTQ
jgi:nitroreductase